MICLAAAMILASGSCEQPDRSDPPELTEDERYLIDAYVDVRRAGSNYPHNPAEAESLFAVLDSTIDSVRIANTIRDISEDPERWMVIFEEIEEQLRAQGRRPGRTRGRSGRPRSKQSRG